MKNTVRIFLTVLLAVAMLFTMTACSSGSNTAANTATEAPTEAPTEEATEAPTEAPTEEPTEAPTEVPTEAPTEEPTEAPTEAPTEEPSEAPTEAPTEEPTEAPVEDATAAPETQKAEAAATEQPAVQTAEAAETEQPAETQRFDGVRLTVFNCYDYIDPAVLDLFEEETGAKIDYVNYTTNEEMYTKLEAGAASYDVIFPSDYMIERLIAEDRLETLNLDNIPNRAGLIDWLKNTDYDPDGSYSVPYMWGTFGILYNTDLVNGEIDSWDALFDEQYAGSVFMMNSQRDTIGLALKKLGYSMNSRDEGELEQAKDLLIEQKQKGIPAGYMLDEIKDKMVGNEAALAVVYSGDALYAMNKNDKLNYVVPKEGSNVWVDGMCIPKGSANKECAEAFINFMCREDVAKMNMDYITYSTPIQAVADGLQTEDERAYAVMNPSDDVISRCEFFHDIADCMDLYEQVWMEIRLVR